jgi:hypothetical protein
VSFTFPYHLSTGNGMPPPLPKYKGESWMNGLMASPDS